MIVSVVEVGKMGKTSSWVFSWAYEFSHRHLFFSRHTNSHRTTCAGTTLSHCSTSLSLPAFSTRGPAHSSAHRHATAAYRRSPAVNRWWSWWALVSLGRCNTPQSWIQHRDGWRWLVVGGRGEPQHTRIPRSSSSSVVQPCWSLGADLPQEPGTVPAVG